VTVSDDSLPDPNDEVAIKTTADDRDDVLPEGNNPHLSGVTIGLIETSIMGADRDERVEVLSDAIASEVEGVFDGAPSSVTLDVLVEVSPKLRDFFDEDDLDAAGREVDRRTRHTDALTVRFDAVA
jgi:hypothetical protein